MIVLNFHGLGSPHDGIPDDERRYWLSFDEFDDLLGRIWSDFNPANFAFTFDDGNHSDLIAADKLAEKGVTGRFFALAGRLNADHYLSSKDLQKLKADGMIVGLHGRDHIDWRACDQETMKSEVTDARSELETALGASIDEVAIPFGRYNRSVAKLLKAAGFLHIHTSDGGYANATSRFWNRNTLRSDMPEMELSNILNGRWTASDRLRRNLAGFAKRNLV
ncbi:polysaccharide deacetylase family protein [Erythrobacter sp. Alg231-14]|uniref:polysaccharide deacetylase family protein n=1 Tax=Erythrobacter sp. Alg231-14 TaxID=1922225 RepID=UPI000D54D3D2